MTSRNGWVASLITQQLPDHSKYSLASLGCREAFNSNLCFYQIQPRSWALDETAQNLLLLSLEYVVIAVPAAQTPGHPDWPTAAGGKTAFEVASVKLAKPGTFTLPTFFRTKDQMRLMIQFLLADRIAKG